jgi:hypothetical protein
MAHIFEQFMGKKPKAKAAPEAPTMGSYFDQIGQVENAMPQTGAAVSPQERTILPPKPPALETPVSQPKRSFGSLMAQKRGGIGKTAAPPEFKKNTMAGFLSDALRAQIISRLMSDQ